LDRVFDALEAFLFFAEFGKNVALQLTGPLWIVLIETSEAGVLEVVAPLSAGRDGLHFAALVAVRQVVEAQEHLHFLLVHLVAIYFFQRRVLLQLLGDQRLIPRRGGRRRLARFDENVAAKIDDIEIHFLADLGARK